MNHFPLYFLSGHSPSTLQALKTSPVADIVADITSEDHLALSRINNGPGSVPGTLFCVPPEGKSPERFGYFPDLQEWHQTADGVWVGWHPDIEWDPDSLIRRYCPVTDFEIVTMADGSLWQVPVLRDPYCGGDYLVLDSEQHTTSFRSAMWRDATGKWCRKVASEYSEIYDESRLWFDWLLRGAESGQSVSFSYSDLFDYAIRVIGLHYRYGLNLNDALQGRFLQTDQVQQIVAVSCGWSVVARHMEAEQKKRYGVGLMSLISACG